VTSDHTTERTLAETPLVRVGEFRCRPADLRWTTVNDIGASPHIVFPRANVVISQLGDEPVLATPNHVIVYGAHQLFRRELRSEVGDHSIFFELRDPDLRLPLSHAPSDAETYLLQHLLVRHVELGTEPDALLVDEATCRIVARVTARGVASPRRPARSRTEAAHRRLVEDAKELLAAGLDDRLCLDDLGRALHTSPYHLARIFRARTGYTLHGYRQQLRVRTALDRLADPAIEITGLAHDLGFSSHSHFTSTFRRVFGVPPGRVRGPREVRRILTATLAAPA
jgi:AraC-like DNA-binding protein